MKLDGLKVVDLSMFLPGPYLSLELADHGASVVKVEQPGEGDPGRHIGLADGPATVFFRNLNRGKKSVVLDLKSPSGLDALLALADEADVFIESFRPGVARRLGIDHERLRARNPRLVYCSISAFGQDGPLSTRPAHDLAVEALSGMLTLNVGATGEPAIPGIPVADMLSGLNGLAGVLMALLRRTKTGVGDYVEISMLDSMVGAMRNVLGPTLAEGRQPDPKLERTTGGGAFYRLYETADGGHIALAGQEPKFIRALLAHLGREDLVPLCLQGPGAHQGPVVDFLTEVFRQRRRDEWEKQLSQLDVCFGAVRTLPDAMRDPHLRARGVLVEDPEGRLHLASPIRFHDEPSRPVLRTPGLGEHQTLIKDP